MSKFKVYDFVATNRIMVACGGSYTLRNYTDLNGAFGIIGEEIIYDDGSKDRQGRSVGKVFTLDQSHYKFQAREGQKDFRGIPLWKFLAFAPMCEGSPNGDYRDQEGDIVSPSLTTDRMTNLKKLKSGEWTQVGVEFRELVDELDAELALETGIKRAEAQVSVGGLDEDTLTEVAAMYAIFGKPDKTMRLKVYEAAGKKPIDYFKYLNAGDRGYRALIRKGLADGVLSKKGDLVYWGETIIGNSEDAVVATLIGDKDMYTALAAKIKLGGLDKKKPVKPK